MYQNSGLTANLRQLPSSIVKMPSNCGPGPYARLVHLEINNTLPIPDSHLALKPEGNPVYELHFDYNFHLLSETRDASEGSIALRVDATTIPYVSFFKSFHYSSFYFSFYFRDYFTEIDTAGRFAFTH